MWFCMVFSAVVQRCCHITRLFSTSAKHRTSIQHRWMLISSNAVGFAYRIPMILEMEYSAAPRKTEVFHMYN